MKQKFVVRYQLPYVHEVVVGITTSSSRRAEELARRLFDNGTIWDDTKSVPLLRDEFDEGEMDGSDGGQLEFSAEAVDTWPALDSSVFELRRRAHARRASQLLVDAYDAGEHAGGSVDWSDLDDAVLVARSALAERAPRSGSDTGPALRQARVLVVVRGGVAYTWATDGVEVAIVDLDNVAVATGNYALIPDGFENLARQADLAEHLEAHVQVVV